MNESETILKSDTVLLEFDENRNIEPAGIFGILVGNSIDGATFEKIENHNKKADSLKIFVILIKKYTTPNDQFFITSDCINFNSSLITTKSKDYTTYEFNGAEYGKGRVVLAAISDFVKSKNILSVDDLQKAFPCTLQGSYDCVKELQTIDEKKLVRYFTNDNDIIKVGSKKVAVCNQWGIKNIDKFITHFNNDLGTSQKIIKKN